MKYLISTTMKIPTNYYININNKKHTYSLIKINDTITHVICESAWIDQDFDNEDIPSLLIDLPELIIENEKENEKDQSTVIHLRIRQSEKLKIKKIALKKGYQNVSSYIRDAALSST